MAEALLRHHAKSGRRISPRCESASRKSSPSPVRNVTTRRPLTPNARLDKAGCGAARRSDVRRFNARRLFAEHGSPNRADDPFHFYESGPTPGDPCAAVVDRLFAVPQVVPQGMVHNAASEMTCGQSDDSPPAYVGHELGGSHDLHTVRRILT